MADVQQPASLSLSPSWTGSWTGLLRRSLLGLPVAAASLDRFRIDPTHPAYASLHGSALAFVEGYNAALSIPGAQALADRLSLIPAPRRGFAYEGAGMGLAVRDAVSPLRGRAFAAFLAGPGDSHAYMLHIGAGWAFARLRRRLEPCLARLDPLLCWLAADGAGFHHGFFHPHPFIYSAAPSTQHGYVARAFDQGLGRAIWFAAAADPYRVELFVRGMDATRRPDLWSGIGLAAAYAGGAEASTLQELRRAAGSLWAEVALGAIFAAKARERAGNPAPHTEIACQILCDRSARVAAYVADDRLASLQPEPELSRSDCPKYERWRAAIRETLAA